jgi:hypothetical protein
MEDRATEILASAGGPLDTRELFAKVNTDLTFPPFKHRLAEDSRFIRCGPRLIGLSEWGREGYTSIASKIEEEIQRNGAMDLDDLTRSMAERFGVAEASVRQYARAGPFEVDGDRRISLRAQPSVVPASVPLGQARGCFRLQRGWALRLEMSAKVLRGASNAVPFAFAKAVELQPEASRVISLPVGEIKVSWPRYTLGSARMGSLRPIARQLGAIEGDRLFLVLRPDGSFEPTLLAKSRCEAMTGLERLALECGHEPDRDPLAQIAFALELDADHPYLAATARARLVERGERSLAELVSLEQVVTYRPRMVMS